MKVVVACILLSILQPWLVFCSPLNALSTSGSKSEHQRPASGSKLSLFQKTSEVIHTLHPSKSSTGKRNTAAAITRSKTFTAKTTAKSLRSKNQSNTQKPNHATTSSHHRVTSSTSLPLRSTDMSVKKAEQTSIFGPASTSSLGNSSTVGPDSPAASGNSSQPISNTTSQTNSTSSQADVSSYPSNGALNDTSGSTGSSTNQTQQTTPDDPNWVPSWSKNNITCANWTLMSNQPAAQWKAVNGDASLQTFIRTYDDNLLICQDCYGLDKEKCTSEDPFCSTGLKDLANYTGSSRQDTAMSIFARYSTSDVFCDLVNGTNCEQVPQCMSSQGSGTAGLALVQSMMTMHDSLKNVYRAIGTAGSLAGDQMTLFSNIFAPAPNPKNTAIAMDIMFVIAGLIAGLIPGIGALGVSAASLLVGVGSAVVMNNLIFDQPAQTDTSSFLGAIINNLQSSYERVTEQLFSTGSFEYTPDKGGINKTISWLDLMGDGQLLNQGPDPTTALVPLYERILFQQLAVYTWQNLEVDNKGHLPFVAFDTKPCNQVVPGDAASLERIIGGVSQSDTNVTVNGTCYYLLDGTSVSASASAPREGPSMYGHCAGQALPGGTNKAMSDNTGSFQGLSLSDFIIPSVLGWQNHGRLNGYENLTGQGVLLTDPQAAGTVTLPVCDYLGQPNSPGVGCPMIGDETDEATSSCPTWLPSSGANLPGSFVDGWCGVHVEQWQRNEGDNNPLSVFQLSITIKDGAGRIVGEATKQTAAETLEVVDSSLPYDVYVAAGSGDDSPISFWYSDQYWDSTSTVGNKCSVGAYDSASNTRQLDCGFDCPHPPTDPNAQPPVSATIAHPFPNTPITAIGGDITFSNSYITPSPTTNVATPTAPPIPTYPTGRCGVHIRQFQKHEGEQSENNTNDFKIQVLLKAGDGSPLGQDALVPAPAGSPVTIPGLVSPFVVTLTGGDYDKLTMSFAGQTWSSGDQVCRVGGYDSGHRDMDCQFNC